MSIFGAGTSGVETPRPMPPRVPSPLAPPGARTRPRNHVSANHRPHRRPQQRPSRRARAAALGALVTLLALAGCDGGPPQRAGMSFATRSTRADFGRLWEGEVREHTFRLESNGSEPIRVDERLDSCGCSSVEWFVVGSDAERRPYTKRAPIAPGETLEVDVVFDSRGREGAFDQPITLYVPFEQQPKIELRLAAQIEPLLVVDATEGPTTTTESSLRMIRAVAAGDPAAHAGRFLDLGRVASGEGASGSLVLRSQAGPIALRFVGPPVPDARVHLEPLEPGPDGRAERFRLSVDLDPLAPAGVRLGSFELASDLIGGDGRAVSSFVRVRAEVRGLVESSPAYLDFDLVDAERVVERRALLVIDPAATGLHEPLVPTVTAVLEAPEAQIDVSDWFEVTVEGAPTGAVVLRTKPFPTRPFGPFRGLVRIDLGIVRQPQLEISFGGVATGVPPAPTASGSARPPG